MTHRVEVSRQFLIAAVTADGTYDMTSAAWQAAEQAVRKLRDDTEFDITISENYFEVRAYGPSGRELREMSLWLSDVLGDELYPDAGSYEGQQHEVQS